MLKPLLTAEQVATILGYDVRTFYRKRPGLEKKGFPRPVEGTRGYDEDAVRLYIKGHRFRAPANEDTPPPEPRRRHGGGTDALLIARAAELAGRAP